MLGWSILIFLGILMATHSYFQDDYAVIHERVNLTYQNSDYLEASVTLFKFNRTTKAYNITMKIKRDLSTQLKVKIQAYRFESNEYRFFPLGFILDACEAHLNNSFGTRDLNQLPLEDCPFKKQTLRLHNYIPDESRFPPHMVAGSYRVNGQIYNANVRIMILDWYGAIKPIEHLRYEG